MNHTWAIKIMSGGQTGADRAALNWAKGRLKRRSIGCAGMDVVVLAQSGGWGWWPAELRLWWT
jgi:hypothetical protein